MTVPALPAGWVATNAQGPAPLWVTSNAGAPAPVADSAPNAGFVDDPAVVSDKLLDTPAIGIQSGSAQVTFRQNRDLESTFDGGVLEVSSPNIAGGAFTDITDAAVGGSFVTGGYTGPISTQYMSPISGRNAWTGNSGGFVTTTANLGPNVAGQTIKLRFRMASDNSVAATGWRVDTIVVTGGGPCVTPTPGGTPTPTPTPGPTGTPTPTPTPTPPGPTRTPTPTPGPCSGAAFSENFDGVTAPALPAGWTASIVGGTTQWVTSASGTPAPAFDSSPNAAFIIDPNVVTEKRLDTRSLTVSSASAQVSFRNNYNLEASGGQFYDGGVLEVSSPNINAGAFTDITAPAVGAVLSPAAITPLSALLSAVRLRAEWRGVAIRGAT